MKKVFAICVAMVAVCSVVSAFGAANVLVPKKANSVAKREEATSVTNIGGSLLPTALGLVNNVVQLSRQQKELVAECEPTSKEITFVNNLVKEWAIAGAANPFEASSFGSGIVRCGGEYGGPFDTYQQSIEQKVDGIETLCYDAFTEYEAHGAVWAGFPKAAVAKYCPDGGSSCAASKQKKVTNLYDIFDMIDFSEDDYTKAEATQASALLEKSARCSGSKLAAKRLETFRGFIGDTISNMGQKTNTASVMETVTNVVGNSNLGNMVGSFGSVAGQLLDR